MAAPAGAGPVELAGDALFLGAANALLRLNASSLGETGRLRWPAHERKAAYCRMNGQSEVSPIERRPF